MDHITLWSETISAGEPQLSFGLKADLDSHLEMLATEFSGQSAALFYHAAISVMVRRKLIFDESLQRFFDLWERDCDQLLTKLDARWLVSAMDTFVDHGRTVEERATALAGTLFMKTIKLYETERLATGQKASPSPYQAVRGLVELEDGIKAFSIGRGDMVFNMMARVDSVGNETGVTGAILRTLLKRARLNDTVYRRFAEVHQRKETAW